MLWNGKECGREKCQRWNQVACFGKDYDLHKVLTLDMPLVEMDALSLNYWMTKFVQEVTKPPKERYPPKSLFQILYGIGRYLSEKELGDQELNPLESTDKRYSFALWLIV